MDNSFNLARHISRLVWLLINRSQSTSEQKLELRAIVVMAREATVRLTTKEGRLACNGLVVPQVLSGVPELADKLIQNRVDAVELDQGLDPAELLAVTRLLAAPSDAPDAAAAFSTRIAELAAKTVHVRVMAPELRPTPVATPAPVEVAAPLTGAARVDDIFRRLTAADPAAVGTVLDEVASVVEAGAREGRAGDAADAFTRLLAREVSVEDPEARRLFLLTTRRLTKPAVLRAIAYLGATDEARAADVERILVRCGEDGVEAAVDQYATSPTAAIRRRCRDLIVRMPSADASLVKLLGDARGHVAALGAELLGLRANSGGERPLAEHLRHNDARVRRAVVRALSRFDTAFAVDALARGLEDESTAVRLETVAALAGRKTARAGAVLAKAIDNEDDTEVQLSMIGAMGRVASSETLSKLTKALDAGSGLFRQKKTPGLRLAAVQALATARTPAALAALRGLVDDREKDVREAAARAVAR